MSKVYLTSFSTPDFAPYLKDMVQSARKFGIKNKYCYSLTDLGATDFYKKHFETFQQKTGFGFWLWKPFYINEALKKIKDGDILFYVDAATLIVRDPSPLIDLAQLNESGIVAFDGRPLTSGQWTKRDAFVNTLCDTPEFWSANKVIATVILVRKTNFTINFCREWLGECENIQSLSDFPNEHGLPNRPDFIAHRMDQSILGILIKKYNIETYRNPSKWGNFLKPERFRIGGEHLSLSYLTDPVLRQYADSPQENSPYNTIFEFNQRAVNPKKIKDNLQVRVARKLKILLKKAYQ